jgi:hypothetical protein
MLTGDWGEEENMTPSAKACKPVNAVSVAVSIAVVQRILRLMTAFAAFLSA